VGAEKGPLRKIDFTDREKVKVIPYEEGGDKPAIPDDIREALRAALAVPDAPKQRQVPLRPASPAPASGPPKSNQNP